MSLRVNLGAGRTYLPGFVNVDRVPWADVSVNVDHDRLPFDDDSVEWLFSSHTLEHFDHYLWVLEEIYRVLQPNGWLLLSLPYVTLTEYHLVNPFHRRGFSEHSFDFFDPEKLKGSAVEESPIRLHKVFHHFHYLPEYADEPEETLEYARRHLFNVVRSIDVGLLAIKGAFEPADSALRSEMQNAHAACMRGRRPYTEKERRT